MSTRSSARNLFPPLDNPELTIRRRYHNDPTLLNNSEMAAEGNGDLPILDLPTMEELCQPSLNGQGGLIAPITIQATKFGPKNDMIQQVQNSCQFHGLPGDDANKHLDKFLHVTQSIKVNGVTDDALRLYLFPYSLTHHATAWFYRLPKNSINTFEQMAKMFLGKYFPPSMVTKLRNEITNFRQRPDESLFKAWERYKLSIDRCPNHNMLPVTQIDTFYNGLTLRHRDTINAAAGGTFMKRHPEECYDLIENMTAHHNDWDTSGQRSESSSSITSSSDTKIAALKAEMAEINKNLMRVLQPPLAILKTYMLREPIKGNNQGRNQFFQGANQGQNQPPAYQVPVYQAPVHQPQIPQPQVVTTNEFTNFIKANDAILKNMQTNMTSLTNSNLELKNMFGQFMKMNATSSLGLGTLPCNTITNPKEDLKGITTRSGTAYQGPMIPTISSPVVERETEATKDTAHPTNNESTKDVQPPVVSTESLILNSEPVIAPIIESVASPVSAPRPNQRPSIPYPSRLHDQKLRNKANDQREKFFQIFKDLISTLALTLLNEQCSSVLLKKFPEKLGDPDKFMILCDFPRMAECLALADLGVSINLMPLSVWNKHSLPDLSPSCMTLELADRWISRPVRVTEDVFVKVGTFHFPTDLVVVDFDADPRVPLIIERSFFKTGRALIDVFEGELTFRVGKEAITFNLDQTSRYSANYNDMTANRIDVIDMACEEYSQEVLGFSDVIASGNLTPYYDPIISTTSLTLTSFGNSDFLLKEVDAFLALEDDPTSPEVDQSYVDTEGELQICEAKSDKSLIDEPPEVELKDLPPHLKYIFLEGDDKFPVIIEIDLSVEEKTALITVLKSHKRAIAWKLSDIKGIDPEFCTHKILMEEDFKPANRIEVDKAKVDVIDKLPHPTTVKGIQSFFGHAGFYRRFIQDFSKIARPMTCLLEKGTPFFLSKECVEAFQTLKRKLTEDPILIAPEWDMPFELMCDASDFAIGAVPGQRQDKHFRPIHYASKTMTEAESNYTTTEKEMLAVVYAFEKFRSCLIMNKSIVYTNHSTLKYLFAKKDSKTRLLRWVLLLQEFTFKVIDTKGAENLAADHLSRLENPHQNVFDPKEINESFPLETLNMVSFR
nr:reverse transcriptase domain-containing protein [Tanacetum cinerariifolium]